MTFRAFVVAQSLPESSKLKLVDALKRCPKLAQLHLTDLREDKLLSSLAWTLSSLPQLEAIHLKFESSCSETAMLKVVSVLQGLPLLKFLSLPGKSMSSKLFLTHSLIDIVSLN
eukprot:m.110601 g.110601  ORF g.110601 m.110601 type:complete len:114 (-) comp51810_c1_seq3:879-1220(-)